MGGLLWYVGVLWLQLEEKYLCGGALVLIFEEVRQNVGMKEGERRKGGVCFIAPPPFATRNGTDILDAMQCDATDKKKQNSLYQLCHFRRSL